MDSSKFRLFFVVLRWMALLFASVVTSAAQAAPLCQAPANLIPNSGFEGGAYSPSGSPAGWYFASANGASFGTWDSTVSHHGRRSVRIDASEPDDANWIQSVDVPMETLLYLGGWVKSENIQRIGQPDSPGATVSVLGRWDQPAPTLGSTPWHSVGVSFNADAGPLQIAARLGFWGGLASGTAWFDDLVLVPRVANTPHPRWKVLVLIYSQTDITYTDAQGMSRHVAGTMPHADQEKAVEQARRFVEHDIPALTSGNMLPSVTVRHPHQPLRTLSPFFGGWWPAQGDVINDLDPAFDSVIVIWEPRVRDVVTGESLSIAGDGAVTADRGLRQTYTTVRIPYAGIDGNRNTYKQQWAIATSSYFLTMGLVSPPPVIFNPGPVQYVNCETGQFYIMENETSEHPIPHSIYNNSAGFLHDYYSGTLALAEAPQTCLGISAEAWAWGGPVTHSGSEPVFSTFDRVGALINQVDALQEAMMLDRGAANRLLGALRAKRHVHGSGHSPSTRIGLNLFIKEVRQMMQQEQILQQAGDLLIEAATSAIACAHTP